MISFLKNALFLLCDLLPNKILTICGLNSAIVVLCEAFISKERVYRILSVAHRPGVLPGGAETKRAEGAYARLCAGVVTMAARKIGSAAHMKSGRFPERAANRAR